MKKQSDRDWLVSTTAVYFKNAQKGEKKSLEDFLRRIESRLFGFFIVLTGNEQVAKDLCQDMYVKLMENIHSLDNPNIVVPWLFRIAKNHFIDYTRSQKYRQSDLLEDSKVLDLRNSPEIKLDAVKLLLRLSEEDRYLAALVYIEGLSYEEVATVFDTTPTSIRNRLYKLKLQIKATGMAA